MTSVGEYHTPVLLTESIDALVIKPGGVYLDATVGGGGHFQAIIDRLDSGGVAIGIDRDTEALEWVRAHIDAKRARVILAYARFSEFDAVFSAHGIAKADGMLFDLGVSSRQIDKTERGFSYLHDAPLDMRMDGAGPLTAALLIGSSDAVALEEILRGYGEIKRSRALAQLLVRALQSGAIATSLDLQQCLKNFYGRALTVKTTATVFQALRIAVNNELDELKIALDKSEYFLNNGGRLAVISYHSLEDRICKQYIREKEKSCVCPPSFPVCVCQTRPVFKRINNKVITPDEAEIARNPRSRSARMRIAEKIVQTVSPAGNG